MRPHIAPQRQLGYSPRTPARTKTHPKHNQRGFAHLALMLAVSGLLIWASVAIASLRPASAAAPIPEMRSGQAGYCLSANGAKPTKGTAVTTALCNGTTAQDFSLNGNHLLTDNQLCLAAVNNTLLLENCNFTAANQDWSADGVGYQNAGNNQCLSLPKGKVGLNLITASCNNLNSLSETWTQAQWPGQSIANSSDPQCTQQQVGQRVACMAERQWLAWQAEPKLHSALLYDYTDGNPSEEWCADFVSYIYQQAGAPFNNGERGLNNWDEYNANNVINENFSYHAAGSGYLPKPGDVAYYNYQGGHVEIVVSGGSHPVFIYGDSGTIDPLTGNGDMAENQIVNDGSAGQLIYYLSPN